MTKPGGNQIAMNRLAITIVLFLALQGVLLCPGPFAIAAEAGSTAGADSSCSDSQKEDCGGACSTCPGKAKAIAGLAGKAKLVLAVDGLAGDKDVQKLRNGLDSLDGVEISVADQSQGKAWVAYDSGTIEAGEIKKQITRLGYAVIDTVCNLAPLPELAKGHERCVVYVARLGEGDNTTRICGAVNKLAGVDGCSLDLMWYMLLVDYDPGQTSPKAVKQVLLDLGYAAGLPGEPMSFPAG
jgi:hypothetical protein